jgi:hypothetical protein
MPRFSPDTSHVINLNQRSLAERDARENVARLQDYNLHLVVKDTAPFWSGIAEIALWTTAVLVGSGLFVYALYCLFQPITVHLISVA